jgi:Tfp pilus assembly protein PilF
MDDNSAAPAQVLFHQGLQHLEAMALGAAQEAFEQALALQPTLAEAHANLGYLHALQGAPAEAEARYRTALALDPTIATTQVNLGALLAQQKRHTEAEACYGAALALAPQSSAVWSNLGALNLNLQQWDLAEDCLRHAMALDAHNQRARFNLAYLQLRRGHLEEGWQLFEARDWYAGLQQQLPMPRWQGEPLHGKSLLIGYEAGHGDMVQFCRYVPLLKAQGARHITLLCHPALTGLLRTLQGVDAVRGFDEPGTLPDSDFWMPMLSAPYHVQTRADTIPATLPYLQADAALCAQWALRLPPHAGLRVGLAWKGNPLFENDPDRSLPHLRTLEPLWRVPGVQCISLQKGAGQEDVAQCHSTQPMVDVGSQWRDFADAAAVVSQLDLVICVDTAIAHVAGALGKPCWLLLPDYMSDWRWGEAGAHTAWYPGVMRLFRQGPDGDWQAVVQEAAAALTQLVAAA